MEIHAGGQKWLVEAHDAKEESAAARGFCGVTFRRPDREGDKVEMRWIPRPQRLTETVAKRLFELAGERLWRDRDSGVIYRIQLVTEGDPGDDRYGTGGTIMARFRTGATTGTVRYDIACPLGLATDAELQALAARALARTVGADA